MIILVIEQTIGSALWMLSAKRSAIPREDESERPRMIRVEGRRALKENLLFGEERDFLTIVVR